MALTGNALGAIADGLSLSSSPSPPAPYGQIVGEVAKLQQLEGDITQAQRRYVLADYGLSMTVGAEVKGRLLTLDQTAALSAGRQAFAIWVTQLYLPAYWWRYHVTGADVGPIPISPRSSPTPATYRRLLRPGDGSKRPSAPTSRPFWSVVRLRSYDISVSLRVMYVALAGRRHL